MARVAQRLFFDIDGIGRVNALPGATFDPGGEQGEAVVADNGIPGHKYTHVPPTAQFKVANTKGMLNKLHALKGKEVNINVQDDNGDSWLIKGATMVATPKLSGGEIDMDMAGMSADFIGG